MPNGSSDWEETKRHGSYARNLRRLRSVGIRPGQTRYALGILLLTGYESTLTYGAVDWGIAPHRRRRMDDQWASQMAGMAGAIATGPPAAAMAAITGRPPPSVTIARDAAKFLFHLYTKPGSAGDPLRRTLEAPSLRSRWTERVRGAMAVVGKTGQASTWTGLIQHVRRAAGGGGQAGRSRWNSDLGAAVTAEVARRIEHLALDRPSGGPMHADLVYRALGAARATGGRPIGIVVADIPAADEQILLRLLLGEWHSVGGGLGPVTAERWRRARRMAGDKSPHWPASDDDRSAVCPFCKRTIRSGEGEQFDSS